MPKKLLWLLSIFCLLLFSGCQNKRELNDLGIVLGMALDRGENSQIKLTVQAVKPGEMKSGQGGGGKGGGSGLLLSGEGKTTFDALRNLDTISSKKLFFSHNQVVIIGEKLAKEGLQQVVDFLERDTELRVEVPLLISRGEAGKILQLSGNFDKLQAMGINKTLQTAEFSGRVLKLHLYNLLREQFQEKLASVVPTIEAINSGQQEMPKISGLAVIKNGRLAGWLNETESRGYLWTTGKLKSGIVVVRDKQGKKIALEIKEAKSKTKSKIVKGRPAFTIKVDTVSALGEVTGSQKITPPKIVRDLEKKETKAITEEINSSIARAKKMKSDIFGFGEQLYRDQPKQWKKIKPSWDKVFTQLDVTIEVGSKIEDFGVKTDPTFSSKGGR